MQASSPTRMLILTAALLAGCGGLAEDAGVRAYVERHLGAWTGVRGEHVVQRFGAPDEEQVLADGARVLTYRRRQPVLKVLDCQVDFRLGTSGRITAAQCSGPAEQCRMLLNPATRYSSSRPAPVFVGVHLR